MARYSDRSNARSGSARGLCCRFSNGVCSRSKATSASCTSDCGRTAQLTSRFVSIQLFRSARAKPQFCIRARPATEPNGDHADLSRPGTGQDRPDRCLRERSEAVGDVEVPLPEVILSRRHRGNPSLSPLRLVAGQRRRRPLLVSSRPVCARGTPPCGQSCSCSERARQSK